MSRQQFNPSAGNAMKCAACEKWRSEHDCGDNGTPEFCPVVPAPIPASPEPSSEAGPTYREMFLDAVWNAFDDRHPCFSGDCDHHRQKDCDLAVKDCAREMVEEYFSPKAPERPTEAQAVDWTDPGHRLTEGELDAAEETYMGETVKSGTYRHRAALEAVIRGYLASNRKPQVPAPDAKAGRVPVTLNLLREMAVDLELKVVREGDTARVPWEDLNGVFIYIRRLESAIETSTAEPK